MSGCSWHPYLKPPRPGVVGPSTARAVLALAVELFGRLEVADERRARLDGDEEAAVLRDPVEKANEQLPAFGKRELGIDTPFGRGRGLIGFRVQAPPWRKSDSQNRGRGCLGPDFRLTCA